MKKILKLAKNNPQLTKGVSAVGAALLKTGISFLKKPAVVANVKHIFNPKKLDKYSTVEIEEVENNADWIVDFLEEKGIKPNRIAIDGLPGSGKSTLAQALSKKLKMEWVSLDYQLSNEPYKFDQNNSIYEHKKILRTQNLEVFDVIIFIDMAVEKIKEQIIDRGQGAHNVEIYDYDLMQEIGKAAFEIADGEKIKVAYSQLCVKIRPEGGFNADSKLHEILHAQGYQNTDKLSKEEKLFLMVEGKAKKGTLAYSQGSKYAKELLKNVVEFLSYVDRPQRGRRH